ncbi:MAG: ATP-dependent DNA ligase [Candidatus Diapherotrites archaeon]|nr:ATP-dependent DNA ligase [Candidatus Diapherotrites archaeon]
MEFHVVAEYFDRLEETSSRLDMTGILAELLAKTRATGMEDLIYFAQGQLAPAYKQVELGMGEKFIAEAIARTTGYVKKEVESAYKEKGDLGTVAEELLKKKKQKALHAETLTLKKVHTNLMRIATSEGSGSQDLKIKLLSELLNSASPVEARFLCRMANGNLRLGIGDPTIMDALAVNLLKEFKKENQPIVKEVERELKEKKVKKEAWDEELDRKLKMRVRTVIEEKYNIHSDLGRIAGLLNEKGLQGLKEVKIMPGIPIRPTLAERLPSVKEIVEKLGACQVEKKYDGFRVQLHKKGNDVWIFSRNQENMTAMFPEIVKGIQEQVNAQHAIVEGEALAMNEATGEFHSFQVTVQRKRKYDIEEKAKELPLKVFLFDAILVENENLMGFPFKQRRARLEKLLKPGNAIELTDAFESADPKKIEQYFEENVANGLEGIMCKDLNAPYIAGARKFAWIKFKRSYKGSLEDTIDAVIVGYFKGRGQRTAFGLGGILTAVYDEDTDTFKTIAKIGTGFTEQQLKEYEERLSKILCKKKPARVESEIEPHHWVTPLYVVELRADEITRSPVHTAGKDYKGEGFALRFPRILKLRQDKKPEQATSVKEILDLYKNQKRVKIEEVV